MDLELDQVCYCPQKFTFLQQFFIISGVIQYGLLFAFMTSGLLYNIIDWESYARNTTIEPPKVEYKDKYPLVRSKEESEEEDVVDPTLKGRNKYVLENTPVGLVAMRYNYDDSVFEYYSDRTIPYTFLEVCGRKYCNMFREPELFLGDTIESISYDGFIDSDESDNECDISEKDLKAVIKSKYSSKSELENVVTELYPSSSDDEDVTQEKNEVIRNTYRYLDVMREFKPNKVPEEEHVDPNPNAKMTFDMFKKFMKFD